ncbi:hypothetical protein KPH14_000956 [Odynerus spinipes]|uniref:Transposase Tc1-like domain-containing protein n=1 Tax=Odynerus spinipes TaxID=1348599 RepID=A0AAD9RDW5_9HYME|nr:hypothetical protein KPH14_000956 [Odynerus spinipes]
MRAAYQAWMEEGPTSSLSRSGCPHATSVREDKQLIRASISSCESSAATLAQQWAPAAARGVSVRTVCCRVQSVGLIARRTLQRLRLTTRHRRERLKWSHAQQDWRAEWQLIVFSNEPRFCVETGDARISIRRRRGERLAKTCVQPRHWHRQRGVMAWGAIAYEGWSCLLCVQGTLRSVRYITEVLQPVVVPLIRRLGGTTFQQDNARPHAARSVQGFLARKHIPVLP